MQYTQKGKTLYIQMSGEIDHHSTVGLRVEVDRAFERSGCRDIVFDFSEVTFMDSSGIGLVIGRYKNAQERGGSVAIAGMRPEMARIYQISGLAKIITSYSSVSEAQKAIGGDAV